MLRIFSLLGLSFFFFASVVQAKMPTPRPPEANPHPPVTQKDKERVAFGELAIKTLLTEVNTKAITGPKYKLDDRSLTFHLTKNCLEEPQCLKKNDALQKYVIGIYQLFGGPVTEFQHTHVIPWALKNFEENKSDTVKDLKEDQEAKAARAIVQMSPTQLKRGEYILHSFAKFANGRWHHLDVIISETQKGDLAFERFYIIEMPTIGSDLPEGVDC